jgi:hypothetical protein
MLNKHWNSTFMLLALVTLLGCSGNSTSKTTESKEKEDDDAFISIQSDDGKVNIKSPEDLENFFDSAGEEDKNGKRKPSKTVDYEKLKALMPSWVGWLKQTDLKGERVNAGIVKFASAEAKYGSDDKFVEIKIVDNAFAAKLGSLDAFGIEIDKTSDDGYERNTEIQGYKAFEQYDRDEKSGSILVNVSNRFLVTVEGEGIDAATLRSAVDKLNLKKLEGLK